MKDNLLLALFIGFIDNGCSEDGYLIHPITNHDTELKDLDFSENWDLLMKVVVKIESLNNDGFDVSILADGTIITRYRETPTSNLSQGVEIVRLTSAEIGFNDKIEHTYQACVEFVRWYNKNTQEVSKTTKIYKIPINFINLVTFDVEASSLQEASKLAVTRLFEEVIDNYYVSDSFEIDGVVYDNYPDEELDQNKLL